MKINSCQFLFERCFRMFKHLNFRQEYLFFIKAQSMFANLTHVRNLTMLKNDYFAFTLTVLLLLFAIKKVCTKDFHK